MRLFFLFAASLLGLAIFLTTGIQSHAVANPALASAQFVPAPLGTVIVGRRNDGELFEFRINKFGDLSIDYTRLNGDGVESTMRPFCWAGCHPKRRPIELERYRKIWPLEVGKSAKFQRKRSDGSAVWVHELKVLRTETVETALGPIDTFVVEEKARGTATSNWRGKTTYWYAPSIGWSVKVEWSDNRGKDGEWNIVSITPPG